jgi:signal transduction histidine kinase
MDSLYSPQHRSEHLIILGRVVLAACSLLAIWLDPSEPAKYAATAYTLLVIYLGYALLLLPLVWRPRVSLKLWGVATQLVDLLAFTFFLYFTEGPSSPFFLYFVFALLCGTLRWQWRGTLWIALVTLAVFLGMGVYTVYFLHDPDFELNRFIMRSVYLAVVAILLGYLSVYEERTRGELAKLATWPRVVTPPRDVPTRVSEVLRQVANVFGAPRLLIAWEEPEEPWLYLATHVRGEFSCTRMPPGILEPLVAEPLMETHFLCLDSRIRIPRVLHTSANGLQRWRGSPLHPELQRRFTIGSVLSLLLRGDHWQGRLFLLDKAGMTSDNLILGEIVAHQVTADMNELFMKQRLQQTAAIEERLHLARDLHDGLLQSLTGVALQLEITHHLLEADPKAARERLQDIQRQIAAEQRSLRIFIEELKPVPHTLMHSESNLAACLEELGQQIERQWDLRVVLTVELPKEPLSDTFRHEIYHLVQEALINAARHARASAVQVQLGTQDEQVYMVVADDGHGYPFHGCYDLAALTAMQLGPVSLKERVKALRGELMITSTESGTRLEITLPLRPDRSSSSVGLGHSASGRDMG